MKSKKHEGEKNKMTQKKMEEERPVSDNNKAPRKPDFVNSGVAVWINRDKNNVEYLSISIVGHTIIQAWRQ